MKLQISFLLLSAASTAQAQLTQQPFLVNDFGSSESVPAGRRLGGENAACLGSNDTSLPCVKTKTGLSDPFAFAETYEASCARLDAVVPALLECNDCIKKFESRGCRFVEELYFGEVVMDRMAPIFNHTGPECTQEFRCLDDSDSAGLSSARLSLVLSAYLTTSIAYFYL